MGYGTGVLEDPDGSLAVDEGRNRHDRRQQPTPMFSRYTLMGGRRRAPRRNEEVDGAYVDSHGAGLFGVVTTVAMLNILDAFFTILFLSYGGKEINPVAQLSLDMGIWAFLFLKSFGIGACLLFLTITKNFKFARFGLGLILVGYTVLLGWHCYLYTLLP